MKLDPEQISRLLKPRPGEKRVCDLTDAEFEEMFGALVEPFRGVERLSARFDESLGAIQRFLASAQAAAADQIAAQVRAGWRSPSDPTLN